MKVLAVLFSFYMVFFNVDICALETDLCCINSIEQDLCDSHEDDTHNEENTCLSFCNGKCCFTSIFYNNQNELITQELTASITSERYCYTNNLIDAYQVSILQPPKIE